MINVNKLKGKIVEEGLTTKDVAKALNINRSTLYRKLNTKESEFTISEANQLREVLNLSLSDANSIFFDC